MLVAGHALMTASVVPVVSTGPGAPVAPGCCGVESWIWSSSWTLSEVMRKRTSWMGVTRPVQAPIPS